MKHTPIYNHHIEAGGKMINFADFAMPINYGSQVEEHLAVRSDCGMFDVSHMAIVDISGSEASDFLRFLLANDIAKLKDKQALYSCMLNKDGGVIDDLIAYNLGTQNYRLVVNAATTAKDLKWMQTKITNFAAKIKHRTDLAMLAIQGPNATEKFNIAMPGSEQLTQDLKPFYSAKLGDLLIARTGYTGEDGLEVILPAKSASFSWQMLGNIDVRPCGLGARDTLRLEAGFSLYGNEMDEKTSPIDAGLSWTVDLNDKNRDFIGKNALQEKRFDIVGLILEDKAIMRAKQVVKTPLGDGVITSGSFSPSIGKSIALARIPVGVKKTTNALEVEMRQGRLTAKITKPAFVKNGKIL